MGTCRSCIHWDKCSKSNGITRYYGETIAHDKVEECCKWFISTADVVPRSEVEELQKKLNDYERVCGKLKVQDNHAVILIGEETEYIPKNVADVFKDLAVKRAKQEVAREIFEEIDEMLKQFRAVYFIDAPLTNYHKIVDNLAELKKKYIGE